MTTKTITNTTINGGYVLSSAYSELRITSSGTIHGKASAGIGLTVPFAALTVNAGIIQGGRRRRRRRERIGRRTGCGRRARKPRSDHRR